MPNSVGESSFAPIRVPVTLPAVDHKWVAGIAILLACAILALLMLPSGDAAARGNMEALSVPPPSNLSYVEDDEPATPEVQSPPDIVLIVTDDQGMQTLDGMPNTMRLLSTEGITFTNTHALTSTCCPARTTMLTGQESKRTGVWTNWAPHGGWDAFYRNGGEQRTLAVKLDQAGYRTGLIGKYLNGYEGFAARKALTGSGNYIPTGWDYWHAQAAPQGVGEPWGRYFDYSLMFRDESMSSPRYESYGKKREEYSTEVYGRSAIDFISSTPAATPLFLMWNTVAPHAGYEVPSGTPKVTGTMPLPASYGSKAGKPPWVVNRPNATPSQIQQVWRKQMRTLIPLDQWIPRIIEELKTQGRWRNTLLVFVSDNGYFLGEYGLLSMKNHPYPASTHVPMIVVPPGKNRASLKGSEDSRLSSLADIPATILAAASLTAPDIDGRNLLSPLGEGWRDGVLISGWRNRGRTAWGTQPAYCGYRTTDWLFIQYSANTSGVAFRELYDVKNDPGAVINVAGKAAFSEIEAGLAEQARRACLPAPPGFRWSTTVVSH